MVQKANYMWIIFLFQGKQNYGWKKYDFFLHTALSVAAEFDTYIFNWFQSTRHIHQTAVPVIYFETTDEIVFNDDYRNIMAWGSDTTSPTIQENQRKFYTKHEGGG